MTRPSGRRAASGGANSDATLLTVPVMGGAEESVARDTRVARNVQWQHAQLNAGRTNTEGSCSHAIRFIVAQADNDGLTPGVTYTTLTTRPLVLEAVNWHGTSVVQQTYTRAQLHCAAKAAKCRLLWRSRHNL